jgi:hypothetical protein
LIRLEAIMHLRLPVVLLSALALAAPGAMAYGKDNDKNKDKKEQKSDDRRDDPPTTAPRSDDPPTTAPRRDDPPTTAPMNRDGKITICHIPPGNRSARHTIRVGESAWPAHDGHGDYRGPCRRPTAGSE